MPLSIINFTLHLTLLPMSDPIWLGATASLLAGSATAVGSVPVLFGRNIPDRWRDSLLGVGGGVMLAAPFFALIRPAIALTLPATRCSRFNALT